MSRLTLSIERIVVETDVEREAAARIPEVLKAAFLDLAGRWMRSPWARQRPLAPALREALEIEPISSLELLGPHGAELLAERCWEALLAQVLDAPRTEEA